MDVYGLLGHPVAHSRSPFIHHRFAALTGEPVEYRLVDVPPGTFAGAVDRFRAGGARGANVTVPYKVEAHALATGLTARARAAGAVNTLRFDPDGALFGDNTDGLGLVRDLVDNAGFEPGGRRILLLGAGGAARGALLPVLETGPAEIVICNRTVARADALADEFGTHGAVRAVAPDRLAAEPGFDLLVNATSASLAGDRLDLPPTALAPDAWCYDMVYAARPTPFMAWAREAGAARCLDGLGMLVEQAAEAFACWRGVRPDTAPVIDAVRASLAAD